MSERPFAPPDGSSCAAVRILLVTDEFVIPDGLHLLIRDPVMHEAVAAQKNETVPVHRAWSLYHAWIWPWSAALPFSRSA